MYPFLNVHYTYSQRNETILTDVFGANLETDTMVSKN